MKTLFEKCSVIYKIRNGNTVHVQLQRSTVVGIVVDGVISIGVSIISLRDQHDRLKAKKVAFNRAVTNPSVVVESTKTDVKKELHLLMREVKEQYDIYAYDIDMVDVDHIEYNLIVKINEVNNI